MTLESIEAFINALTQNIILAILAIAGLIIVFSGLAFFWLWHTIRNVDVPEGAGPMETLRHVPISLAVALDALDLMLDFFAAPFVWVMLRRYGLQSLRNFSVIEMVIPGTQLLPTMTALWFAARHLPPEFEFGGQQIVEGLSRSTGPAAASTIDIESRPIDREPTMLADPRAVDNRKVIDLAARDSERPA